MSVHLQIFLAISVFKQDQESMLLHTEQAMLGAKHPLTLCQYMTEWAVV